MSSNLYDAQNNQLIPYAGSATVGTMRGASATTDGLEGSVPRPLAGDQDKYLKGDGSWSEVGTSGSGHTIVDSEGAEYTQRSNLVIDNGWVEDDSTNNATVLHDRNFIGTRAEWEALTLDEKSKYTSQDIIDEYGEYPIDPTPTQGSTNPVSSGGVYTSVHTVQEQVSNSDDAYSASKAYSVGDLVIYNNTLYKCITACSAAAWSVNSSCFTADTLVNILSDESSDTGWVTINNNLKYRKKGNTVSVLVLSLQVTTWTSVGTLPAGTWPPVNLFQTGFADSGTACADAYINSGNGNVYVYGTNNSLYVCFTYLV